MPVSAEVELQLIKSEYADLESRLLDRCIISQSGNTVTVREHYLGLLPNHATQIPPEISWSGQWETCVIRVMVSPIKTFTVLPKEQGNGDNGHEKLEESEVIWSDQKAEA